MAEPVRRRALLGPIRLDFIFRLRTGL